MAGALSYGCYVVAKAWLQQQATKTALPSVAWQPPAWAWVQLAASAVRRSVAELQTGDRIIVQVGEMIPVAGLVLEGVAWVKCRDGAGHKVDVGSQVEALTIVQTGCIWLRVAWQR